MVPFLSFRMLQSAGGVSESEESVMITISGTGGSQTISASSWTSQATNLSSSYPVSSYGTSSNGTGGVLVRAGSGVMQWSDNLGVNWTACNGVNRASVNAISGLKGRTDSNTNASRWVAHVASTGYESNYYSNDGKSWSFSNVNSYSSNFRAPSTSHWDDSESTWVGLGQSRDLYVSNDGSSAWTEVYAAYGWNKLGSGGDTTASIIEGGVFNGTNNRKVIISSESNRLYYLDSNDMNGTHAVVAVHQTTGNEVTGTTCETGGYNAGYTSGGFGKIDDPTNPGTLVDGWLVSGDIDSNYGNSTRELNGSKDGIDWYPYDTSTSPSHTKGLYWSEENQLWYVWDREANSGKGAVLESADGTSWDICPGTSGATSGTYWGGAVGSYSDVFSDIPGTGTITIASQSGTTNKIALSTTGASASGSVASISITGDASAHSGVAQTVTFANGISATDATTQVKLLFTDGTIGGYTVTNIDSTSFTVTSTAVGDETNLSFSTSAGTSGSLGSTLTVTDGAG